MKKINLIFFIASSTGLIVFDIYKASHSSFTHDESYTYLHYVNSSVMDIISYRDAFTNNHILNSLLMKISQALWGSSELALRLPNILSHILYLVFSYKFFSRYSMKTVIPFFILMNANPFLIDFFILARGYGIAIGLMTAGLYYYCRYIEKKKTCFHILALTFLGFASLANFALINIFVGLILIHNLFQFWMERQPFTLKNIWLVNKENLYMTFFFTLIFFEPARKILENKLIDFGGGSGYWHDTVGSLTLAAAYDAFYTDYIILFFKAIILVCSVSVLIIGSKILLKKLTFSQELKRVLFFAGIFILLILVTNLQKLFMETPFPKHRFALFLYPVFFLLGFSLYLFFQNKILQYFKTGILSLCVVVFLIHFFVTTNTVSFYIWKYDMHTKEMLNDLSKIKPPGNQKIQLGITWIFEPTINFYRVTKNYNWLCAVDRNGLKPEHDYFYLVPDDLNKIPACEIEMIRCYNDAENCLVKNKKIISEKVLNNQQ
jgi:hypothetical protein